MTGGHYRRSVHGIHRIKAQSFIADPTRYFRAIAELRPLFFDEVGGIWVCHGYTAVKYVLSDARHFAASRVIGSASAETDEGTARELIEQMLGDQLLFLDGTEHRALRSSARAFLTMFDENAGRADRVASELLARLPDSGLIDFVRDYASKWPLRLASELLDVEEGDLEQWAEAYETLLGTLDTFPAIGSEDVIPILTDGFERVRASVVDKRALGGLLAHLADAQVSPERIAANAIKR
jgi:cytochrome P450